MAVYVSCALSLVFVLTSPTSQGGLVARASAGGVAVVSPVRGVLDGGLELYERLGFRPNPVEHCTHATELS